MPQLKSRVSKPGYLFIVPWSLDSIGGVSQVVENLILQMKKDNIYNPILMINSWDDVIIRKEKIKNIDHFFFRIRSIYNNKRPIRNLLGFFLFFFSEFYTLHRFLKVHNISVINIHYFGLNALTLSLLKIFKLFKGKLLLSFHGKYHFTSPENGVVAKQLWKLLLRTSDRAVTCSEALKNEVAGIDEKSIEKIVAIHNGIDTSFLENERNKSRPLDQKLEGRKFILNVAAFDHRKGQDILLEAFVKIESLFPEVDLVMIGSPEAALNPIKNLIQDFGLEYRVWLYEGLPHNQIAAFYENATIFALPSRIEPFGIVILEAGIFGLPVVASRVGGISEIVFHNQTAILCESEDCDCFAHELMYLLERPDERERLGKNLKVHVMENFSWDRAYRKYIKCLK
ncbi:glycosyltransferase family 4 protein [uncultured Desulfobacter sp.]|uniref:glycosyltransferase family 4 protein n=1 Tax=uncultured Desulfobacter sp. TaxID=240139 RepID=UPI0029C908CA|nr:glycosyltransferase family 4 protein [uncultured Desulfobacter sp.]